MGDRDEAMTLGRIQATNACRRRYVLWPLVTGLHSFYKALG